jgi:hypothetical protein
MKLIYMMKVYYWTIPYTLNDFYDHGLGKNYVKRLKQSLVAGKSSFLYDLNLGDFEIPQKSVYTEN